MEIKTSRWIFVLIATVFATLLGMLSLPVHAHAAKTMQPAVNSCLTCHEDQYYLYDTGKLYCLTDHTDRCTNCHEGDASVMVQEEAHDGLLAHPQENNGAKCQECHTAQVTRERLALFASEGGFDTVIKSEVYAPSTEIVAGFPDFQETNKAPWIIGALVLFALWSMLVYFSPQEP